jgi:hypothetical protein
MLIANAFNILSQANVKIASLGADYVDQAGTPKQPRTLRKLIRVKQLYNIVSKFILLNDAGTAITGTFGQNDAAVNRLLIQLKWKAEISTFPNIPNPISTFNPSQSTGDFLPEGSTDGDLLVFEDGAWSVFSKGADTYVLTSTPTGLVWAAGGATGLPSGGSTGQVLKKNSATSYDVVWGGIATTDITGVTASAAEINILDGVTGVSPVEITYLANVSSDIQTQFTGKLDTGLTDGYFLVGNVSNVATAVAPTGDVTFDNTGLFGITPGAILNADINNSAAISRSKLASGSSYRVLINDISGVMSVAAGITPSRVLVSDANGIPTHSPVTSTTLGYLDATSSIQTQLNNRLTVSLTSPTQGDLILYNGTNWVNLAVGTSGQVLTSNGTTASWGNSTANGIPAGGSTNQILRKASATDYDTEWHSFVTADITDLSTTVTELNQLSGVTVTATEFNKLAGLTGGTLQNQLANKLSSSLTYNSIFVGNGSNVASQLSAGSDGYILTIVSGAPAWIAPTPPGDVSGPGSSTDNALVRFDGVNGDAIQEAGIIVDDSDNLTFPTGAALQTGTTATNTLLLQAYDVDGTAYVTFGTLTANNDPTFDLNQLVTVNGDLIYRTILGQPLTAPSGAEVGQSFRWNAGGTAWEYFTPGSGGGDVTGPVSSTDNAVMRWDGAGGDTAQDSGVIVDDSDNISGVASLTVAAGGALRTGVTDTNTLLLQAYDVDGAAYTTFATLTAGNTPTMDLATGVTIGAAYIYRVGGTDVSLADGGTGASLSDPGADRIMFWDDSAGVVTWLAVDSTLDITGTTLSSVYNDESAQDAVGGILTNTTTINLTYNDGAPSITADVNDGSLVMAKLNTTGTASSSTYLRGDGAWTDFSGDFWKTSGTTTLAENNTYITLPSGVVSDVQISDSSTTKSGFGVIENAAGQSASIMIGSDNTNGVSLVFDQNNLYGFGITGMAFRDTRVTTKGIEYAADYSTGFTNRSLVDKGYTDGNLLGSVLAAPTGAEVSKSIRWNAGGTAWEYYTPGSGGGDVATDTIWDAAGDLAVGSGANTAVKLSLGATNTVLKSVGGNAVWDYNAPQIVSSATTRTISDADFGSLIILTSPTGCTVTIDNSITIPNFWCSFIKGTAMSGGDITFVSGTGSPTLNAIGGLVITETKAAATWTRELSTTTWYGAGAFGTGGGGDVVGPASATDNAIARYDGTTGKLIQDSSLVTIGDTGILQFGNDSTSASGYVIRARTSDTTVSLSFQGEGEYNFNTRAVVVSPIVGGIGTEGFFSGVLGADFQQIATSQEVTVSSGTGSSSSGVLSTAHIAVDSLVTVNATIHGVNADLSEYFYVVTSFTCVKTGASTFTIVSQTKIVEDYTTVTGTLDIYLDTNGSFISLDAERTGVSDDFKTIIHFNSVNVTTI